MVEAAADLPDPLPFALLQEGSSRPQLGQLLLRDGVLSVEQLEQALAEKENSGRRIGEIVLGHGWVSAAKLARLLAEQHGLEFLELDEVEPDAETAGLLSEKLARRYQALPVRFL